MKKLSFILFLTLLLSFTACADVNLTRDSNVYEGMVEIIQSPEKYEGKTIRISSTYSVTYSYARNKLLRHTLVEQSETGASRAIQEIVSEDGRYPIIGARVTAEGRLGDDKRLYITNFADAALDDRSFDIDALDMSAEELKTAITSFCKTYTESEIYGKRIRIFGHCVAKEGYYYLLGLDGNGSMTWTVELYDPQGLTTVRETESTSLNTAEVVGELTLYAEDNLSYACILVESITLVDGQFS
jgi:hypothetical protein